MTFDLDGYLNRLPPAAAGTNLDSVFSDPARSGMLMEMPFNLPEAVIAEIKQNLDAIDFNRYPAAQPADLQVQIADWLALPAGHRALFGNGAFEIIDLVMQSLGPGGNALTLEPDFFMYRLAARKYRVGLETHELDSGFAVDPAGLMRQIDAFQPGLIVLSNPHNPTSVLFPAEVIEAILERAPGLVLVDEIYAPFAPEPNACIALLDRHPNLLLLRSFSKLGAAAIRFGFLLGHGRILDRLAAWQTTFAVNGLSMMVAGSIIRHYGEIEETVRQIVEERELMIEALKALGGAVVYPSRTNFVVVRLPETDAGKVCESLVAQGVKVVPYDQPPVLKNCLRFSVDTPANNRDAVARLGDALSA